MARLSWSTLTRAKPGQTFPDPVVPGLRYRVRTGGIFAELRYKAAPGKWKAVPLGPLPSLAEVAVLEERELQHRLQERFPNGDFPEAEIEHAAPDRLSLMLAAARKKAAELSLKAKAGDDPRAGMAPQQATDSLGAIADRWIKAKGSTWSKRTLPERKRHLERDWAPFRDRQLSSLGWEEIEAHLGKIARKELRDSKGKPYGGPIAANRSRSTLHSLCRWAKINPNPVAVVDRPTEVEEPRARTLTLPDLRTIWRCANGGDYGVITRLCMLTGKRREEVGGMDLDELDLEASLWRIPRARCKARRAMARRGITHHEVALSWQAAALISGWLHRPGRDPERKLVFGRGKGGFSGWSRSKERLDGRCQLNEHWTLHDCRRTMETLMIEDREEGGLEIDEKIASAALSHVGGSSKAGIAAHYNHAKMRRRIAEAMQLWSDTLLAGLEFDG